MWTTRKAKHDNGAELGQPTCWDTGCRWPCRHHVPLPGHRRFEIDMQSAQQAAETGCRSCRLWIALMTDVKTKLPQAVTSTGSIFLDCFGKVTRITVATENAEGDRLILHLACSKGTFSRIQGQMAKGLMLSGKSTWPLESLDYDQPAYGIPRRDCLISHWLESCCSSHQDCNTSRATKMPKRLLRIEGVAWNTRITLCESTKCQHASYLAFSYW